MLTRNNSNNGFPPNPLFQTKVPQPKMKLTDAEHVTTATNDDETTVTTDDVTTAHATKLTDAERETKLTESELCVISAEPKLKLFA